MHNRLLVEIRNYLRHRGDPEAFLEINYICRVTGLAIRARIAEEIAEILALYGDWLTRRESEAEIHGAGV